MVDANRRPQRQPARLFNVVGVNGMQLPQPQAPEVPSILPADNTAQYLGAAQQSVQQGFALSQQVIDSSNQARIAEARSQASFPGTFANLAGAIQAGVEGYQAIVTGQQELEEQQAQEAEERRQAQLAADFEQEVRNQVTNLQSAFVSHTLDEGYIPTVSEWLRERRRFYSNRGLSPSVLQTVTNIGWEAINNTQRERGARVHNQQEELKTRLQEDLMRRLSLELHGDIVRIRNDPSAMTESGLLDTVNSRMEQFFADNPMSPIDQLTIRAGMFEQIQGALEEAGTNFFEVQNQRQVLGNALQQAIAIYETSSNNPTQLRLGLASLQLELDQSGINIDLTGLFRTDQQRMLEEVQLAQAISNLYNRESQSSSGVVFETPQDAEANDVVVQATALSWINDPVGRAVDIEAARSSDAPLNQQAALSIYNEFQDAQTEYFDLLTELREIDVEAAQFQADIELLRDEADPTGRLGNIRQPDLLARRIIEIYGQERSGISPQAEEALLRVQQTNFTVVDEQARRIQLRLNTLTNNWVRLGFDLQNPSNTRLMDERYNSAIEYINRRQTEIQSSPPPGMLNFPQGLPPLPQR